MIQYLCILQIDHIKFSQHLSTFFKFRKNNIFKFPVLFLDHDDLLKTIRFSKIDFITGGLSLTWRKLTFTMHVYSYSNMYAIYKIFFQVLEIECYIFFCKGFMLSIRFTFQYIFICRLNAISFSIVFLVGFCCYWEKILNLLDCI